MVEAAFAKDVEHGPRSPRLFVPCPEHHAWNPGQDDGAGAHGTGLQGHHEGAVRQPPAVASAAGCLSPYLELGGCLADSHHLGVRGGITVSLPFVPPCTQDFAVRTDHDGADGHVFGAQRAPCLGEGKAHPLGMARLRGSHGSMIVSKIRQAQTTDELGRRSENLD